MDTVLHLMPASAYAARAGAPVVVDCPPGGFIHCTGDAVTLRLVANAFYRTAPGDFVVLVLDAARLGPALRWEAPDPPPPPGAPLAAERFPHLYAPLPRDAILAVRPAQRAPDGTFVAT
jgi:uncharacterized protein (DUF952 family)